jgi:hypothetical protein
MMTGLLALHDDGGFSACTPTAGRRDAGDGPSLASRGAAARVAEAAVERAPQPGISSATNNTRRRRIQLDAAAVGSGESKSEMHGEEKG